MMKRVPISTRTILALLILLPVTAFAAEEATGEGFMSQIRGFFEAGGTFIYVNCVTLIWGMAIIIERMFFIFFRYNVNAEAFMAQVQKLVMANNIERAIKLCNAAPAAALPRVVKAGLTRANRGEGEIRNAVADSLKSVASGSSVVTQVGTIIESLGDEVAEVAERIRSLSNVLEQQRAATSEITHNVVRISEKATKSKDEVQKIGKRLEDCEDVLRKAFDGAELPIRCQALMRLGAEALFWKRQLAQILLGAAPAPASAPQLPHAGVLAEADEICKASGGGSVLASDLSSALAAAQSQATKMVDAVRTQNWGNATPAYVACDEAIAKAHQAIAKLLDKAATAA